jgi:hypothetical protein
MRILEDLATVFGEDSQLAFKDIDFVRVHLDDANVRKRFAALQILVDFWKLEKNEAEFICQERYRLDQDAKVRALAIRLLGDITKIDDDKERLKFLARIAISPVFSNAERRSAYFSLCEIRDLKAGRHSLNFDALTDIVEDKVPILDCDWLREIID